MHDWIREHAEAICARAERELAALVAVSSPSGDAHGAEEAVAVASALAPEAATIARLPCSSPGHARDLLISVRGRGRRRVLLLGHLDTVVSHEEHRPLQQQGDRLVGSGAVDMKGGVVLALGVLRALVERDAEIAEAALLLVCDEEWRLGPIHHVERFADYDACLCFEAGELAGDEEAVVVRRKAAATVEVNAYGRSAHAGAAPERGANALLALAVAAQALNGCHDPDGARSLTCVPTVLRCGSAFNVIPESGELIADVRADALDAVAPVLDSIPADVDGVRLEARVLRQWPGMDARAATAGLLDAAGRELGRPIVASSRGGASDASHFAARIALTIDGLGPRGGGAHAPDEFVLRSSLRPRAEVALAVAHVVLAGA